MLTHLALDTRHAASECTGRSQMPLVSVIVVNYNQGMFLREAIASVLSQTYKEIECLIVDDKSTDGSEAVIDEICSEHPEIRCLKRRCNGGQTAASFDGLTATRGSFIHFLDADDYISDVFIETHVSVHLSLRLAVGFTCCDAIERHGNELMTFGNINIARYRASPECTAAAMRPFPEIEEISRHKLRAVAPGAALAVAAGHWGWPWSASSAFVYRRAALEFFTVAGSGRYPRHSTDTIFALAINAMTGSVIIDEALTFYRCHGANVHAMRVPMNQVIGFDRSKVLSNTAEVIESILLVVLPDADRFRKYFWKDETFFKVVGGLFRNHPNPFRLYAKIVWPYRKPMISAFGRLAAVLGCIRILAVLSRPARGSAKSPTKLSPRPT